MHNHCSLLNYISSNLKLKAFLSCSSAKERLCFLFVLLQYTFCIICNTTEIVWAYQMKPCSPVSCKANTVTLILNIPALSLEI